MLKYKTSQKVLKLKGSLKLYFFQDIQSNFESLNLSKHSLSKTVVFLKVQILTKITMFI